MQTAEAEADDPMSILRESIRMTQREARRLEQERKRLEAESIRTGEILPYNTKISEAIGNLNRSVAQFLAMHLKIEKAGEKAAASLTDKEKMELVAGWMKRLPTAQLKEVVSKVVTSFTPKQREELLSAGESKN